MYVTKPIVHVHLGSSPFKDTKSFYDARRHTVLGLIDLEVFERPSNIRHKNAKLAGFVSSVIFIPFGLSPPVTIRRNLVLLDKLYEKAIVTAVPVSHQMHRFPFEFVQPR